MIKIITETINKINYKDLNEFIRSETKDFYFNCFPDLQIGECQSVFVVYTADEYEIKLYHEHMSGKFKEHMTQTILNVMCFDGKIKAGKYLVSHPWR